VWKVKKRKEKFKWVFWDSNSKERVEKKKKSEESGKRSREEKQWKVEKAREEKK
jgi:hypothetical protein